MVNESFTPIELEIQSELRFVENEVFIVLHNSEIRALLFDLANDVNAGDDLGQDVKWGAMSADEIRQLVEIAVRAAICRIIFLMFAADGDISTAEIQFALRTLTPLLNDINQRMAAPFASLDGHDGVLQLQSALEQVPQKLFHARGMGGRASSLLRFCSLCDPFVEAPLLPVLLRIVRQICVNCAIADGLSKSEEKVLASFDRLAEKCKQTAENVSTQLPHVRSFVFENKEDATLSDLIVQQESLRSETKHLGRELQKSQTTSSRIARRLDDNLRREAEFIGDNWNFSTAFIAFSCLVLACGIGWVSADYSGSISLGLILAISVFVSSLTLVIKKLLHLSWYSTKNLIRDRKTVSLNRYRCWRELANADGALGLLQEAVAPLVAQRDQHAARQQEEARIQRRQSIDSYRAGKKHGSAGGDAILLAILIGSVFVFFLILVAGSSSGSSAGGTTNVRGYFRNNGTYVSPHTRRR